MNGTRVFFFNDTATTEIYTLSLHDALPILPEAPCGASADSGSRGATAFSRMRVGVAMDSRIAARGGCSPMRGPRERKSKPLQSRHSPRPYAGLSPEKTNQHTPVLRTDLAGS